LKGKKPNQPKNATTNKKLLQHQGVTKLGRGGGECLIFHGLGEEHRGEMAGSASGGGGYSFFLKLLCAQLI